MRHSIRLKISLMILGCSLFMVAAVIFMNTMFLDKFYMVDKYRSFEVDYGMVDDYLTKYNSQQITQDEFKKNLEQITAKSNMSIMIIDTDWSIVYASMRDVDEFIRRLQSSLFEKIIIGNAPPEGEKEVPEGMNDLKTVIIRDNYSIYEIYNSRMNDTYLELIGNMTNGNMIYMTLPVRSIEENVAVSNRFIIYVGLIVAIVATVAAFMIGAVIARPIKELSAIAEKMSELDFDAVYSRSDKSEIGLLGNSMNKLSGKLKSTISELKQANIELQKDIETKEQIDEMRKDFLSNVSHELKTPIALIQGYAEGLKEGITDDPESTEFYCDVIMDEAGKMNAMVKKLLTLNQMEFGNEKLDFERFDLVEVIAAVINSNKLLAEQKNIRIYFENKESVNVWADEYKIEEVITNYLTNAINHCADENIIDIKVKASDDVARVSVFNTGKQIPENELDNIWVKFYKVDKARTREYGGSGIGLSIVKAIMEQHNRQCGVINHTNGVEFWFEVDARVDARLS